MNYKEHFPWNGHRAERHHNKGVGEVRRKCGDEAADAAILHIISDKGFITISEEINKIYIK